MDNKKKILVVDDSALMRRIVYDIINLDEQFCVQDMAANGLEAISLMQKNTYDAVILDIIMPKLDGIGVLKEINRLGLQEHVVMFSSETRQDAEITLQALELGAMDFIHKPDSILEAKRDTFVRRFLAILSSAVQSRPQPKKVTVGESSRKQIKKQKVIPDGNAVVAIACSTGGPKALAEVIPKLPENLDAPVLIVQHMPEGFTKSLAQRLDERSPLHVMEAENNMEIQKGCAYIARGGKHMEIVRRDGKHYLILKDGPAREGVRPCANFMYESLAESGYARVVCVVMTGMGADGTAGIRNLHQKKPIYVIAQQKESCAVYGMPRSIVASGLTNQIEPVENVADAIIKSVGVK